MSLKAMNAVWTHSEASGGARLTLLALADWADDAGHVVYCRERDRRQESIARKARISVRQLRNVIDGLIASGELAVTAGGHGPGDIAEYRILLPELATPQELAEARAAPASKEENISALAGAPSEGPAEPEKAAMIAALDGDAKAEIISEKAEVFSEKAEIISGPYREEPIYQSTLPPYPQSAVAAGPPAEEAGGGGGLPQSRPADGAALRGAVFAERLKARLGGAAFGSWFASASFGIAPPDGDGSPWRARIGLPTAFARDMALQRHTAAAREAAADALKALDLWPATALAAMPRPAITSQDAPPERHPDGPVLQLDFAVCAEAGRRDEAARRALQAAAAMAPEADGEGQGEPRIGAPGLLASDGSPRRRRRDKAKDGKRARPGFDAWVFALAVSHLAFGRWDRARFGPGPDDLGFTPPRGAVARALAVFAAATADNSPKTPPGGESFDRIRAHWRDLDAAGRILLRRRQTALAQKGEGKAA